MPRQTRRPKGTTPKSSKKASKKTRRKKDLILAMTRAVPPVLSAGVRVRLLEDVLGVLAGSEGVVKRVNQTGSVTVTIDLDPDCQPTLFTLIQEPDVFSTITQC